MKSLLISEKVSSKARAAPTAHFNVTDAIKERRGMQKNSGFASGDALHSNQKITFKKSKKKKLH
ncbi:hypothetical protein [Halpernia sp. GG3]